VKQCNTLVYDPVTDTWSTTKAPSTDVSGCGVAVVDDLLYVIGGSINEQNVPIGYYHSTDNTTITSSNSVATSKPEPPKFPSSYLIVATLAIVAIIGTSLFFYFKRKPW
jgi:hypothetical protein